jgi:hypothetical protein
VTVSTYLHSLTLALRLRPGTWLRAKPSSAENKLQVHAHSSVSPHPVHTLVLASLVRDLARSRSRPFLSLSISHGCSLTRSGGAAAKQEAPAATQEPAHRMQPRATGSSKKKHRGPSYFAGRPLPPGRDSLEGLQGYKKCSFWSDACAYCVSLSLCRLNLKIVNSHDEATKKRLLNLCKRRV